LCRFIIWMVSVEKDIDVVNALDFVVFGFILHTSNINEIAHVNPSEENWKTIHSGMSVIFLILYALLFACYLFGQANIGTFNLEVITYIVIVMSVVSFLLSFAIYDRLSKLNYTRHHD